MKRATRGRSFSVEHRAVRTIKLRNCVHRELNRNDTHLAWQFIIKKEIVRSKYHPISLINFLIVRHPGTSTSYVLHIIHTFY